MRLTYRSALVAGTLIALSAASLAAFSPASFADRLREDTTAESGNVGGPPSAVLLDTQNVEGILGKEVRGAADENMGRIIDVVVDRTAQPRAAVIDFGGFLGLGSRKIAVDWSLLHFDSANDGKNRISVELTSDQVRAAPEYKPGKPVVITSGLVTLPSTVGSGTPD
jgi:PRC-barrel domain